MHANSPTWTDENQLKCEKVRFLSEKSEINAIWFIFNLLEWTLFNPLSTFDEWDSSCVYLGEVTGDESDSSSEFDK